MSVGVGWASRDDDAPEKSSSSPQPVNNNHHLSLPPLIICSASHASRRLLAVALHRAAAQAFSIRSASPAQPSICLPRSHPPSLSPHVRLGGGQKRCRRLIASRWSQQQPTHHESPNGHAVKGPVTPRTRLRPPGLHGSETRTMATTEGAKKKNWQARKTPPLSGTHMAV